MINKNNITTVTKVYFYDNSWSYSVIGTDLNCSVPNDPANTDYQEIQEWIQEGNTVIDNGGNS